MEHSHYIKDIKAALRRRGIHYAQLAEHLGMSESGVKKMLTAKDISFRRIVKICELMDVLPGQLLANSEQKVIPEVSLTVAQQEALIQSRPLLAVYWRFAVERYSLEEILRLQKMTEAQLSKHLQKLVSLKLIGYKRKKFITVQSGKFKWSDDDRLAQFLNREWSELTLQRALKLNKSAVQGLHRLSALRLSARAFEALLEKLDTLVDEVARISEREELSVGREQLGAATLLIAVVNQGLLDSEE